MDFNERLRLFAAASRRIHGMDEHYTRRMGGLPQPKFQGPLRQTRFNSSWFNDEWETELMFGKMTIKTDHEGVTSVGFEPSAPKPQQLVVDHRKRDEVG